MEAVLRRQQAVVLGCLATMVAVGWLYLLDMSNMTMPALQPWTPVDLLLLFVMWAVMMVAMMLPSAAPMTLAFLAVNQRRAKSARGVVPTYMFVMGYIAMWSVYCVAVTLAQWGLHEAALISPAMVVTSPYLSGSLLVAAGVFQWTPLKRACLVGCRSPLAFLMSEWREGAWGTFVMGLRHGSYCVGCCWILMALLFVTGVMSLFWVAVIAMFVMAEKLLPYGDLFGRIAGVVLAAAGVAVIAGV